MKNKTYFVYAYFLGKRAIYVGHTTNLKERDWAHSHYSETEQFKIPFNRFMAESGGREKFSLKVLVKVKTERQAIKAENLMMEKYKTHHKFGGLNFCPAQLKFNNGLVYDAWVAALSSAWTPKRKQETSARMTANNPSKRAGVQESISEIIKKKWRDPKIREAMMTNNPRNKGKKWSPEQRRHQSDRMKKWWTDRRRQ